VIARFLARLQERPKLLVAGFALLVAVAAGGMLRLRIDTDLFSLLPRDLPGLGEFLEASRTFGTLDAVYGLLEAPDSATAHAYADAFATAAKASPRVRYVVARFLRETVAARGVPPEAVLFSTPEDLRELRRRLDPAGFPEAMERVRGTLLSPLGARAAYWVQADPLGLQPVLLRALRSRPTPGGLDPEGYWGRGEDGSYQVFVYVEPARAPGDLAFSEGLVADLRDAADRARQALDAADPGAAELRAGFTGAHVVAVEEARALRTDLVGTPGVSLALVLAVCWIYFRRARPIAALGVSLGVSMLLGLGSVGLFTGGVNAATAGFAAVLCGIADDYAVHLYNRRRHGGAGGLAEVFRVAGRSVGLGAATTAAAFLVLACSSFPGMRQFGLLMAGTTLASLVVMTTLFVALAGEPRETPSAVIPRLAAAWEGTLWRHRVLILGACAAAVPALFWVGMREIRFEPNLRNLSAPGETQRVQEKILRLFGNRLEPVVLWWEGGELAEGLAAVADVERAAAASPAVDHVETPLLFHPSPASARAAQEELRGVDPEAVAEALREAARAANHRPEAFAAAEAYAAEVLRLAALPAAEALARSLLPPEMGEAWGGRFSRRTSTGFAVAAYVYPAERLTSPDEARAFARDLGASGSPWRVAGIGLLTEPLQQRLLQDLRTTSALAALLVVGVAILGLRSPVRAALALAPVAVASAVTLGLLGLLGIPLNPVNFVAIPLVLGLGIDYGLHLVTVAWAEPDRTVAEVLAESGVAITSNAATTLFGFAALLVARHGSLASLGSLACLGIAVSWLATLGILPPLLRLARGGKP